MHANFIAVVPVLVGPLQVLLALLPAILVAVFTVVLSLLKPRAMRAGLRLLWRLKIHVVVVAAALTGAVWGLRTVWPPGGSGASELQRGDEDWPLFRGGPARCGTADARPGPDGGGINWVFNGEEEAFFASPAVVGNRVYIVSAMVGAFSQFGAIYCLDTESGALVWRAEPEEYRATFSSAAIHGDVLVCGEGLHETDDARVVCLDIREGPEAGRVRWSYRTASHVECTPVISGGRVYVGAGDDGYYCFELEPPGDEARVVWHAPGDRYPDAETSLLVEGDRVYAGLGVGGKAICVLDAATGEELLRVPTPYPVFSPPALSDGKIFVGMGNGDYINPAEDARDARVEALREEGAGAAEYRRENVFE